MLWREVRTVVGELYHISEQMPRSQKQPSDATVSRDSKDADALNGHLHRDVWAQGHDRVMPGSARESQACHGEVRENIPTSVRRVVRKEAQLELCDRSYALKSRRGTTVGLVATVNEGWSEPPRAHSFQPESSAAPGAR
jgi:hypothetical protein